MRERTNKQWASKRHQWTRCQIDIIFQRILCTVSKTKPQKKKKTHDTHTISTPSTSFLLRFFRMKRHWTSFLFISSSSESAAFLSAFTGYKRDRCLSVVLRLRYTGNFRDRLTTIEACALYLEWYSFKQNLYMRCMQDAFSFCKTSIQHEITGRHDTQR